MSLNNISVNKKSSNYFIISIYTFLVCGIICNKLELFQSLFGVITSILLTVISAITFTIVLKEIRNSRKGLFIKWCIVVLITTFILEAIGVEYGYPFGIYEYTPLLQPQILRVPIAIPLSWVAIIICSKSIANQIIANKDRLTLVIFSSLLVLIFDVVLEPAAKSLNLWEFQNYPPPIQNYITWFLFALAANIPNINIRKNTYLFHLYFSQIIFFLLIQ